MINSNKANFEEIAHSQYIMIECKNATQSFQKEERNLLKHYVTLENLWNLKNQIKIRILAYYVIRNSQKRNR